MNAETEEVARRLSTPYSQEGPTRRGVASVRRKSTCLLLPKCDTSGSLPLMPPKLLLRPQSTHARTYAALLGFLAFAGVAAQAFTSADADAIFDAHAKAFYKVEGDRAWYAKNTEGGKTDFWMAAEQMEMVLDTFERTKNPAQLAMFANLFRGFLADHGKTWERNQFNDDIMWMVIACARAYLVSNKAEFCDAAKANFDLCYARAASPDLGGGLWWTVDNRSKNACVNGPGAIAAFLLSKVTGDASYLTQGQRYFPVGKDHVVRSDDGQGRGQYQY